MTRNEGKINLKIWVPIICIIVVGVTFYMMHDIKSKIEKMEPENKTNSEENAQEESQESEDNVTENISEGNKTNQETTKENKSATKTNRNQNDAPAKAGVTDQKQKAIELVKKKWGEDDTVNYVFDYVNENEEYVIAVKDKASATVKYYFRVNLETETVELD